MCQVLSTYISLCNHNYATYLLPTGQDYHLILGEMQLKKC